MTLTILPHSNFLTLVEKLRTEKKNVVILETGGNQGWSYACVENSVVQVPEGEEGLLFMRDFVKKNFRSLKEHHGVTPPFQGGFVGFVSYDLGERWMETQERSLPGVPLAHFIYTDEVYASLKNEPAQQEVPLQAHMWAEPSREDLLFYYKAFSTIKQHLISGETYQVNYSVPFRAPYAKPAAELYAKLALRNPSPYQFFMETVRWALVSNSPERLMQIDSNGTIETRPIKGTVPRGGSIAEDEENAAALLGSKKNEAELAMIVDLERNDLGKVCVPGSVRVTQERGVEFYSHVIHTVAKVEGVLAYQYDWLDALRAIFPGGSVTGCPKKRTMELIAKLEDEPRGVYCGSAGYVDLAGACDFNIMIRTVWIDKETQVAHWRAGGGIIVDSDTHAEYEELLNKAAAIRELLENS